MGRMRYPSLSLHGIEGAFSAPGAKTVIPAKVSGKFSIRYALLPLPSLPLTNPSQPRPRPNPQRNRPARPHPPQLRIRQTRVQEHALDREPAQRETMGRGPEPLELRRCRARDRGRLQGPARPHARGRLHPCYADVCGAARRECAAAADGTGGRWGSVCGYIPVDLGEADAFEFYSSTNEKLDRSNFIEGVSAFTTYASHLPNSLVCRRSSWAPTCTKLARSRFEQDHGQWIVFIGFWG